MKTCSLCGQAKQQTAFHKDSAKRDGLRSDCKDCVNQRVRKYYADHREQEIERANRKQAARPDLKEYRNRKMRRWRTANQERDRATSRKAMRAWRERNPVQARAKWHYRYTRTTPSPELTRLIAELLAQPCAYCGDTENITIDHVIPLTRAGTHEASNLAPACQPCNSSKSNRLLSEWNGRVVA